MLNIFALTDLCVLLFIIPMLLPLVFTISLFFLVHTLWILPIYGFIIFNTIISLLITYMAILVGLDEAIPYFFIKTDNLILKVSQIDDF